MRSFWFWRTSRSFTSTVGRTPVVAKLFGFASATLPDFDAIARTLQNCGHSRTRSHGRCLHCQIIKNGLHGDVFLANKLMVMYGDLGMFGDAHKIFDNMSERNSVSWNTSISMHNRAGNYAEALRTFERMLCCELFVPNDYTLSSALKACSMVSDIMTGKWIHGHIIEAGLQSDIVLMNAVMDMYVKCRKLDEARMVFDVMSCRNSTSWNIMIAGYCTASKMVEAENLFHENPEPDIVSYNSMIVGFSQKGSLKALECVREMHKTGMKLDQFTFPCALHVCGGMELRESGEQIQSYIIKCGSESHCLTGSSLISMYSNCNQITEATKIFNIYCNFGISTAHRMPLWNSMASGLQSNGFNSAALAFVSEMHSHGFKLDSYTFSTTLRAAIDAQELSFSLQIQSLILRTGLHLDLIVGSVLVDLYVKWGSIDDAFRIFTSLPQKDTVTWAVLISGYVQKGYNDEAFSLFKEMISKNIKVDHIIISSILKACSSLAGLHGGKQVHAYNIKCRLDLETIAVTSLIDMYTKCGDIESSLKVFESLKERDAICWTGIIVGCDLNGKAIEAIILFEEMLSSGVKPNEITFLGVLSACSHAGLYEEAFEYLELMINLFRLLPSSEHYCCIVDILKQAGRFQEAKWLISNFTSEDESFTKALLSTCAN